jgi:hypothetical protein
MRRIVPVLVRAECRSGWSCGRGRGSPSGGTAAASAGLATRRLVETNRACSEARAVLRVRMREHKGRVSRAQLPISLVVGGRMAECLCLLAWSASPISLVRRCGSASHQPGDENV